MRDFSKLRPYQSECAHNILNSFRDGDERIYVKLATGSGKTHIFIEIAEWFAKTYSWFRCLFIVPKVILIEQTEKKFSDPQIVGVYNSKLRRKELDKQIIIGTYQSLVRAKDLPIINLIVIDECHRLSSSHLKIYDKLKSKRPQMKLLGLTATDYVIDDQFFQKKVYDISRKELTKDGHLCNITCKGAASGTSVDLNGLKIRQGDYVIGELEERYTDELIDKQLVDCLSKAHDRKKILFLTTSIRHAERVHSRLEGAQIIHSKQSDTDQAISLAEFKERGRFLVSVLIASEGFDFPPADCLVLMRATRSPTLYDQAVGRISRNSPGKKDGLFLDYGGVIETLGHPYEIRCDGKKPELKFCSFCDTPNRQANHSCYECGTQFLTICEVCMKTKPYGESCCPIERDVDPFKNLTEMAYGSAPRKWQPVDRMTVSPYLSAAGNECAKIIYFYGLSEVAKEFIVLSHYWAKSVWENKHGVLFSGSYKTPEKIRLVKEGKYWKVAQKVFSVT